MLRYRISIQCFMMFYVPVTFLPYSFHDPYFQVLFISFHDERKLRIENLVACPFHGQFPFVPFPLLSLDSTFHPFPFMFVSFSFRVPFIGGFFLHVPFVLLLDPFLCTFIYFHFLYCSFCLYQFLLLLLGLWVVFSSAVLFSASLFKSGHPFGLIL